MGIKKKYKNKFLVFDVNQMALIDIFLLLLQILSLAAGLQNKAQIK